MGHAQMPPRGSSARGQGAQLKPSPGRNTLSAPSSLPVLPRAPAGRTPQQPEALGAHSLVQGGQLRDRGQDEDCALHVGRHAGPHDRRLCSETNGLK